LKRTFEESRREIRRLILERLVLGRNWGMNYISKEDVPKGLPKIYPTGWYYDEIELAREGLLLPYKKRRCYRLNEDVKSVIEALVGKRVPPQY